jgi:nanoRNase/pAp phosphatase (c-di-AMP/oligoRNAs hydrolase)
MENPKDQLVSSLKSANNVLVTVSANPSVDQLSAAIGLTLMLNKMDKHATAVYSGGTPSTIEFLQPEKTLEKNTDSLRDFIIALDKSKADKLRYKVEEDHVKIFITPYRTSLSDKDLEFSQGDFNVDVVVALGVTDQKDLDQAITAHGRILHDATTVSVTTGQQSSLGTINWIDPNVSSLCEMVTSIADGLQANLLDGQMATALMTGIVAETDRFSNEKTTSGAMSASAKLMAAGANQQLVATKLQESAAPVVEIADTAVTEAGTNDGSLQIAHAGEASEEAFVGELPELQDDEPEPALNQIHINEHGEVKPLDEVKEEQAKDEDSPSAIEGGSSLILEPPTLGGKLTANSEPEGLDPSVDPLAGGAHDSPLLSHQAPAEEEKPEEPLPDLNGTEDLPGPSMTLPSESPNDETPSPEEPAAEPTQEPEASKEEPNNDYIPQTLSDLEESVDSPHLDQVPDEPVTPPADPTLPGSDDLAKITEQFNTPEPSIPPADLPGPDLNSARDAVSAAIAGGDLGPLPPLERIGSQPLDLEIKQTGETGLLDHIDEETGIPEFKMPDNLVPPITDLPADPTASQVTDPTKAPEVPPPFMPDTPGFDPNSNSTLPPMPNQDQLPEQGDPQNPFNLPPA